MHMVALDLNGPAALTEVKRPSAAGFYLEPLGQFLEPRLLTRQAFDHRHDLALAAGSFQAHRR